MKECPVCKINGKNMDEFSKKCPPNAYLLICNECFLKAEGYTDEQIKIKKEEELHG